MARCQVVSYLEQYHALLINKSVDGSIMINVPKA